MTHKHSCTRIHDSFFDLSFSPYIIFLSSLSLFSLFSVPPVQTHSHMLSETCRAFTQLWSAEKLILVSCPLIICTVPRAQVSYRCPFTAQDIPGTVTHTHTQQEKSVSHMCTARNQVRKQDFFSIKLQNVTFLWINTPVIKMMTKTCAQMTISLLVNQ